MSWQEESLAIFRFHPPFPNGYDDRLILLRVFSNLMSAGVARYTGG
jgi:hypothetical protein